MTEPRIYTYKITFPNQGWWYWGVHKEKKAWNSKGGKQGTGKKWFNDSKSETLAYECPIGHKKGRLPR